MRALNVFLLFALPGFLFAGEGYVLQGGRSAAMAHATVACPGFWSISNNQAGMAYIDHSAAGFYYENRFMVKALSLKSGAFVLPVSHGVLGASLSYFGYPQYNESNIGLSFAKAFGKSLAIGLKIDYLLVSIGEDYGHKGLATFELGLMSKLNDKLTLGAHVYNPQHARLDDYDDERLPAVLRIGAAYAFDEDILVSLEVEKDSDFDPVLKAGFEYQVVNSVFVRGGISTNPGIYSFGFGVNVRKLKIDISSSVHEVLGFSPQLSMIYQF